MKILLARLKRIAPCRRGSVCFGGLFDGWEFTDRFRLSVKNFINKLGVEETIDSMEQACFKIYDESKALKYFCGICWTKIREN